MRMFSAEKTPVYCEGIAHRLEKRRGEDVKVVDLTLKVAPFTRELASSLDQDEYGFIKRTLFSAHSGEPTGDIKAVEFNAPSDRQRVVCFASPDTEVPSIAFDQVRVMKFRARTQKDISGWSVYLHVTFGPVGRAELEYVNAWYTEQRFLTFEAAEPSLDFDAEDEGSDADEKARQEARPLPEWDDDPKGDSPATVDAKREVGSRHKLHSHQDKKKGARRRKPAVEDEGAAEA